MSITIKDIAKIAGVSHTTVSRALNNSPLIKDETKQKIKDIARDLDYVADRNARGLVSAKSNNIGLFFSSITRGTSAEFFQEIIGAVSSEIPEDYNLVINAIDRYENYSEIHRRNYDGIILVSQTQGDDVFITEMIKKEIPMVVINRSVDHLNTINILSDDESGVYQGISYLIEKDYKEIGFIEGKIGYESSKIRKSAYMRALRDYKIDCGEGYIVTGDYTINGGYQGMKELLALANPPRAVFCSNDDMAFGAAKVINEAGLRIPEDIAIMGFDNSLFGQYMVPALTTIKRPIKEISIKGARLLFKRIQGQEVESKKIYLPTLIIKRHTA